MLLNKTDKARDALGAGPSAGLTLQDRRILILTDGKRSLNQVMSMLGPDILPAIDRLMRDGYITRDDAAARPAAPARAPAIGGAMTGLLRAATEAVQARTEQIRAATPTASASIPEHVRATIAPAPPRLGTAIAAPVPPSGTRRSLAASKMYLLDMLQLQRSAEAAELRAAIQCSTGPARLVDTLFQALRMLVAASPQSYGERIVNRLAEILPEDTLPRLEALRAERARVAPLTIVAA